MAQGENFLATSGAAASVQNIVLNLQNLVVAVNALTATAKSQFGVDNVYTAATLPTVGAPARAFVSDSSVAATGNFGVTVTGSGTNYVPVYWDNTSWKIG